MKNIKYIAAAFLISGMMSAQNIDLNAMPKAGATPVVNIAKPHTFQMKNGLTVMVVENNKLPRVNVSLTIDGAPIYEGDIAGVGSLFSSQMGKGTTKISKDEYNKQVDFLGARISFGSNGASANMLSKYYPQVMGLMAQAIINPNFSAEELAKDKERMIEGLKADEKNPNAIANRVFDALTFGKNTANGEFSTKESVERVQLSDVKNYYAKYFNPDNAYLVIVGDVKFSDVKKLVEKEFSGWKKANVKDRVWQQAQNLPKTEINVVDLPNAVQSVIKVGNISKLQITDPLYFAGILANDILGGGAEARLFMNLREKNGFTYGAYSRLSTSKYTPQISAEASVRNDVTDKAIQEFMTELNAISSVKPEELALVKAKTKGNFIMALERPETIARFALNQKLYNLPANFYTNYLKSVDNVTISDISKVVKENILPNQTRIFVAGKASDISESIEKLGYPVKYFDKEANPVAKPVAKKIDANISVASIAQKYIDAIGGKSALEKINTLTTNASATVQGMALDMQMIQGKGGKSVMDMKMMGNSMQKIVFDGKEGYIQAQGQKMPLPSEATAELAKKKEIFPELSFATSGAELKGVETINGEDAYVVKLGTSTTYYSVKSGLKVGETQVQKMGGQEMKIPTFYSDYKEVNGVKLPFKISQNMQGMDIDFTVKSYEINKATDKDFK